jgi:hypothetical protein
MLCQQKSRASFLPGNCFLDEPSKAFKKGQNCGGAAVQASKPALGDVPVSTRFLAQPGITPFSSGNHAGRMQPRIHADWPAHVSPPPKNCVSP